MMFKKWSIYISLILFLGIGFSNCSKTPFEDIPEVPLGTVLFYVNGEERAYDEMYIARSNIDKLICGFRTYLNGVEFDKTLFSLTISERTDELYFKYITIIDGDQPTEQYNLVEGTEILEIIRLDWDKRICNIRFGGTFIREGRDTWDLEYPYRVDCYAIIHTEF